MTLIHEHPSIETLQTKQSWFDKLVEPEVPEGWYADHVVSASDWLAQAEADERARLEREAAEAEAFATMQATPRRRRLGRRATAAVHSM